MCSSRIQSTVNFINTADLLKTLYDSQYDDLALFPPIDRWRVKIDNLITSLFCNHVFRKTNELGQLEDRQLLQKTKEFTCQVLPYLEKGLQVTFRAVIITTEGAQKIVDFISLVDPTKTTLALKNFLTEVIKAQKASQAIICLPLNFNGNADGLIEKGATFAEEHIKNLSKTTSTNFLNSYLDKIVHLEDEQKTSFVNGCATWFSDAVGYFTKQNIICAGKTLQESFQENLEVLQQKTSQISSNFLVDLLVNTGVSSTVATTSFAIRAYLIKSLIRSVYTYFSPILTEQEEESFNCYMNSLIGIYYTAIYIQALHNWNNRRNITNTFGKVLENVAQQTSSKDALTKLAEGLPDILEVTGSKEALLNYIEEKVSES
jgi:hypothetical protein